MKILHSLAKIIDDAVSAETVGQLEHLRLKQFFVLCFFGISTMVIFGVHNFLAGDYTLVGISLVSAFSLVVGCAIQVKVPASMIVYRSCTAIFCVLLLYMFILGGEDGSKSLWLLILPLIVFFLLGKKEGAVWTVIMFLLVNFLLLLPGETLPVYPYSSSFLIRLLVVYIIIGGISGWFEHFRSSYYLLNQQGNKKFQEILENSRDILYRRNIASGRYDYISNAFFELLGYHRKERNGYGYEGVESLIHPEDQRRHDEYVRSVVGRSAASLNDSAVEYRMRDKVGNYFWFSDRLTVVNDEEGKPDHVIGINREITSFRNTRIALEKTQEQLHIILNSIDAHVYVADMESHQIIFMNKKMRKDFGSDLQGGVCFREFRNLDEPCKHCTNNLLLDDANQPTGGHQWECYNPLVKRWYNNYDRAIQWVDGRWVRLQIAVDITRTKEMEEERKRNAEALLRADHMEAIGNLAGGIAHDLNNLLQIVDGNLSLLESSSDLMPSARDRIRAITVASSKASELACRLITFAPGDIPFKKRLALPVLLKEVIKENMGVCTMSYDLQVDEGLWSVTADEKQLKIALNNLVKNSCESMKPGEIVMLSASNHIEEERSAGHDVTVKQGKYVKLQIRDSGCGIAASLLPKIFDPYFTTKDMGTRKGLGLGLSVSYSVIKKHGGYIDVDSVVGVGTSVYVYLPVDLA